jgi:hypothetical protein
MSDLKSKAAIAVALLFAAAGLAPAGAAAITAEVAKKCDALVAREFPLREPGNPAAGSAKGTAQAERDFFNQCVANGGTMNGPADNNAPPDKSAK